MDFVIPGAAALLLAAAAVAARRREAGLRPSYASEVYFLESGWTPPPQPWRLAYTWESQTYLADGGASPAPGAVGDWLYGPRPPRGFPGVLPFGGAGSPVWFQPAA